MVRVRKLVLAIAAASALSSGAAYALGLGEASLKSSLNQPLGADIELFEVRDLSAHEITPRLASPEEFAKAGIDRQFFLSDLTFTPIIKPNGQSVIRVTSNKTVREPYLNFLIEVNWPNGRLLREYTLLLDPPLYSPQTTAAATPQLATATATATATAAQPSVAAPTPARVVPSAPARKPVAPISADQYKVERNDTLWEIARRVSGGSVHQTMLAIVDLNPDAFIGGNINRMKSGQVLRLPDAAAVQARGANEAVAQVAEHNAAWREGRAIAQRQIDATHRSDTAAAPATAPVGDNLKLVAADVGQAVAGSDKSSIESGALADKLAVTQEALDSTRRENAELKSRLDDLQRQLEILQKLVAVKDSQFAQMQAAMAESDKGASSPILTGASEVAPDANAATAGQAEVASVESGVSRSSGAEETAADEPDFNYSEEPAVAEPSALTAESARVDQATEEAAPEPAVSKHIEPEPTPASEPVVTTSLIDDILANPTALGVAGGSALLLLLVGLMALSRRNASKEAELQAKLAEEDALDEPFTAEFAAEGDAFEGLAQESAQPDEVLTESVTAQTGDALAEADIYIAYGRFNQAAELLHNAINEEPQRSDLRLKLMEVYAELGDRTGFASQENELREIGGAQSKLEHIKARYPAMTAVGVVASTEAVSLIDELAVDEHADVAVDDLSLDGMDIDLESDSPTGEVAETTSADIDRSLNLEPTKLATKAVEEFDLSLDELEVSSVDPAPLADELADFSLDLDEAELSELPASEHEALDFTLDEPLVEPELAGEHSLDLSADFDLSLEESIIEVTEPKEFAAKLEEVSAQLDEFSAELQLSESFATVDEADVELAQSLDVEDDFDFLSGTDEAATKLDLARAYIDMGDAEGARDILEEVVAEGNDTQQQEAREMIAKLV